MHEYYYKDVATRSVVNAKSSLPWSTKRTVLTQEVLRILLRCSPLLPWKDVTKHIDHFMLRMQFSGYQQNFKAEVLKSALQAHENMKKKDKEGTQPLYRPKEWKRTEREKQKRNKKENWFKKGGNETVVFVPATPQSKLKKAYEEEIRKAEMKVKVVERSGQTIKSLLQKSDPSDRQGCEDRESRSA